jgi:hypothetical protein
MIVIAGKNKSSNASQIEAVTPPLDHGDGYRIAKGIIWGGGICLYISVSIITNAWWITWLIFPILACVQGITTAIFDLKEACKK